MSLCQNLFKTLRGAHHIMYRRALKEREGVAIAKKEIKKLRKPIINGVTVKVTGMTHYIKHQFQILQESHKIIHRLISTDSALRTIQTYIGINYTDHKFALIN